MDLVITIHVFIQHPVTEFILLIHQGTISMLKTKE